MNTLLADVLVLSSRLNASVFNSKEIKMFYNPFSVEKNIYLDGKKFNKRIMMENGDSSLTLVAIEKEGLIDTHTSKEDAAVYILDGEIELHFDAQKFTVKKGEMLMFKKDTQHKVFGVKNSKFILIKI